MKILVQAALVAAAFAATPALAQSGAIAVPYADLDLSRAEDRAKLDLRLLHAARAVCGTPSPVDARTGADCVAAVRAAVDRQLQATHERAPERRDMAASR